MRMSVRDIRRPIASTIFSMPRQRIMFSRSLARKSSVGVFARIMGVLMNGTRFIVRGSMVRGAAVAIC